MSTMTLWHIVIFAFLFISATVVSAEQPIDGQLLSQKLKKLGDEGLGVKTMQVFMFASG